jgi:hypothetical protein
VDERATVAVVPGPPTAIRYVNPPKAVLDPFGDVKLGIVRSAARAISLDMCSNTYLPFVVESLIAVVFVALTMPFTRNATTATIRMHATPSVTTISTIVKPGLSPRSAPSRFLFGSEEVFIREPTVSP